MQASSLLWHFTIIHGECVCRLPCHRKERWYKQKNSRGRAAKTKVWNEFEDVTWWRAQLVQIREAHVRKCDLSRDGNSHACVPPEQKCDDDLRKRLRAGLEASIKEPCGPCTEKNGRRALQMWCSYYKKVGRQKNFWKVMDTFITWLSSVWW